MLVARARGESRDTENCEENAYSHATGRSVRKSTSSVDLIVLQLRGPLGRGIMPVVKRALVFLAIAPALAASCADDTLPVSGTDAGGPDGVTPLVDAAPDHVRVAYDGAGPPPSPRTPVAAELVDGRASLQALMFAAGEMQISGEPFASHFAGRNLPDYDRTYLPTDQYIINNGGDEPTPVTDLFGFSTAVESYEYSKYHMNMIAQQTSAGLSLQNGPVVSAHEPGATPLERIKSIAARLMTAAGTDVAGYAVLPPPANNTQNYLGFNGLWPTFAPFRSFDTATVKPHHEVVKSCTFQGGYGGIPTFGQTVPEYECAYNSLHIGTTSGADPAMDLVARAAAVESVLVPGVLGLATWKEALWAIDFTGRLHDAASNPVNDVAASDRNKVGTSQNLVLGTDPLGAVRGTFIGSTPLEGMWGLLMLAEMENAAELLVTQLTTTDGATLSGFPTKAAALSYDYTSPLRWFPAAVKATEDTTAPFPVLVSLAIDDAKSRSEDLAGLLLGNAMFFGMTDARNAALGQQLGLTLTFDGDPFPLDNGFADGEETAHDRALGVLRVAFVNLDRMHADPTLGVLLDTATVSAGVVTRGDTVTTTSLAHAVIGLRQTLLSLNASITQYGAADPDPAADAKGILNDAPIHPPGGSRTFSARVRKVLEDNAKFVRDVLTKDDGTVFNGAKIAGGAATPDSSPAHVESHAAALRALVEGFLVTGDSTYRDRARAVATRLAGAFYSAPARMFRGEAGGKDEIHMSAERFAWLQSALRETHKVLHVPGDPVLDRTILEDRIARANKLFLNGWDDLDGNQQVDLASECLAARLQMAEQALTGELGRDDVGRATTDRDSDCVPEIDNAERASVLASDVFFHSP
jgi:hypothetical protein